MGFGPSSGFDPDEDVPSGLILEDPWGLGTEVGFVNPGTLTGPLTLLGTLTGPESSAFFVNAPEGTRGLCDEVGRLLVDCRGCLPVIFNVLKH